MSVASALPLVSEGAVAAIETRDLVVTFGGVRAVDGVSFSVRPGEMFGLLGPNGAGKTTTIRVLNSLLPPVCRRCIRRSALDVRRSSMAVRRVIGYVPQQLSIDAALTGARTSGCSRGSSTSRARSDVQRIADALEVMGLSDAADRLAGTYSGGMIRRLELAQALVNRPRILILDEPTIGLDPVARVVRCGRASSRLRAELGLTVLLTTHYMDEADALCDRVAMMNRGRLRAVGSPAELKAALGPTATLDDVFRRFAGEVDADEGGEQKLSLSAQHAPDGTPCRLKQSPDSALTQSPRTRIPCGCS